MKVENTSDAFLGRNEKKCFASKYVAMYIYIYELFTLGKLILDYYAV